MKNLLFYSVLFLGYLLISSQQTNAQNNQDLTSWDLLAKVTWAHDQDTKMYTANFDQEIEKLNEQKITVKGYLYPLGYGAQISEFLLTPYPINGCFYCVPGSSETMIYLPEIAVNEIPYTEVNISGEFHLVRDSAYGLLYEMKNASISE